MRNDKEGRGPCCGQIQWEQDYTKGLLWVPHTSSQVGPPLSSPPSVPSTPGHHSAINNANLTTSLFQAQTIQQLSIPS